MKNEKETCCYININYCDFDGRGVCRQGKERNRISNRIGNRIRNNFYFLINQNVLKLQIIIMSLNCKAEKKVKKVRKKREDDLQREKTENCFTRTYDVIRRNFEKSSSHEINEWLEN